MRHNVHRMAVSELVLFLAALIVAAGPAAAAEAGIERSFDVAAGGTLRVEAEGASVEVWGRPGERLDIEVSRRGDDAEDIEDDYDVRIEQSGDDVIVEIRRRRRFSLGDWLGVRSLRLEAAVPARFDVDVETSGGSVEIAELRGEVRVRTSGGSLSFEEIEGPVWGRTSGGSVRMEDVAGDADVKTSGGSIRIGRTEGAVSARTSGGSISIDRARGGVTAKTSGGSIEIREAFGAVQASTSGGGIRATLAEQPQEDCRLTTSGGSIRVALDPSIAVDVDAHASGGRVRSDLSGLGVTTLSKHRLEASLNGGGPQLYARSSGGSVTIEERRH